MDGDVVGDVFGTVDRVGELVDVDVDEFVGLSFDGSAVLHTGFELVEWPAVAGGVDGGDVRGDGVGESFGAGAFDGVDDFGVDVAGLFAGQRDAGGVVSVEGITGEYVDSFG